MSDNAHVASGVTPFQKFFLILAGLVTPIVIYLMVTGNAVETPAPVIDVARNIKPLAAVEVAPDRSNYVDMSGEEVFNQACAACHTTGLMNAPKVGDQAGWSTRIALGYETLTQNAISGIRTMPARGGNPDLTDLEMARAVAFMANQSGANFTPPQPVAQ